MVYIAEPNFIITPIISILTIIISLLLVNNKILPSNFVFRQLLHQVNHGIVKCNNKYTYYTYININTV